MVIGGSLKVTYLFHPLKEHQLDFFFLVEVKEDQTSLLCLDSNQGSREWSQEFMAPNPGPLEKVAPCLEVIRTT